MARGLYGAGEIIITPKARTDLKTIADLGLSNLPICMAKTQYSFSEQPNMLGRPEGFKITVREIEIAAGAGFLIPICGDIMRMPGLPDVPAAEHIDLDVSGILRREQTLDAAGDALIDMIIRTANGRITAAEALGHREFVMTKLYRSA